MNHLLLTLLALLTGVVAQVTPAAAVSGSATEIGSAEVKAAGQIVSAETGDFSRAQAVGPRLRKAAAVRRAETRVQVRTVLTGIDRAHE